MEQIRANYKDAPQIHVILDRGPANTAVETKITAKQHGITLHYLPPYSPNLSPIERVWKLINEQSRNNLFHSANEFRSAFTLIALMILTWTITPERALFASSLSDLKHALSLTSDQIQQLRYLRLIGFAIGALFAGPICDHYGRRKVLVWGMRLTARVLRLERLRTASQS